MRNNTQLLGVLLTAGALTVGALTIGAQTEAAEPQSVGNDCRIALPQSGVPCAVAKPVHAAQQTPIRARAATRITTKAGLDRSVCGRLQTQLERDTCLNRVEATV
jgi:hypothetical protein